MSRNRKEMRTYSIGIAGLGAIGGRLAKELLGDNMPGYKLTAVAARNTDNVSNLDAPLHIFSGSVREAAKHFPANVNVAAALSLAGIGPDRTTLEVWADPALTRNTHCVAVESDSSNFSIQIQNTPSDENPATGRITPQSVIALLRGLNRTLKVGN